MKERKLTGMQEPEESLCLLLLALLVLVLVLVYALVGNGDRIRRKIPM
jgi:hypothetical protein